MDQCAMSINVDQWGTYLEGDHTLIHIDQSGTLIRHVLTKFVKPCTLLVPLRNTPEVSIPISFIPKHQTTD